MVGSFLLVAEPQRDRGGVDAGVEQVHRRGVTHRVHRDPLGLQRPARVLRGLDALGEAPLDRIAVSVPPSREGTSGLPG